MASCNNLIEKAVEQIRDIVGNAVKVSVRNGLLPDAETPVPVIEIPADTAHGDFATNAAMSSAKAYRLPPRKIAEILLSSMSFEDTYIERAEIAGPGFINFFLSPDWFADALLLIGELGNGYGRTDFGKGKKVMVEFVSANPTGPMHMGNARGGAIGDCLASALDAAGYDVTREFYVNDAGNQIDKFASSLEARYLQIYKGEDAVPFPEDGYHGGDITERAKEFNALYGDQYLNCEEQLRRDKLVEYALEKNITSLREDLLTYRIEYDKWFFESVLHADGTLDKVMELLKSRDAVYEKEGALWYKATEFGGEKDEVLIRQNGNPTYFAADIAYHYNKFAVRGFDTVIDVWGADHHGHVARLKGAMDAIGLSGDRLDIVLMQLVRLMKDGEPYRMSKRTGKSITLSDLTEIVPIDAARFFFNMREPGSTIDFDLDLAVQQTSQNPVYYVQYAHARICSIVKKLADQGIVPRKVERADLLLLTAPEELALIRRLAEFPGEIITAATKYDPAGITHYIVDIATLFHKFYASCRVLVDEQELLQARLCLCLCARTILHSALTLLKITAPESM